MNGIWVLLLLIFAAFLPVFGVFFWLRVKMPGLGFPRFLLFLSAGFFSVALAALVQGLFFSQGGGSGGGIGTVFFGVFVRAALVEEAGRLAVLVLLFRAGGRRLVSGRGAGAAAGLSAGLGFAALESAFYGTADVYVTLLRAFTAAPLHGACGLRAGAAAFAFREKPAGAFFLFVQAAAVHGAYNLLIVSPAFPSFLAAPTAFAAFFASLHLLENSVEDG